MPMKTCSVRSDPTRSTVNPSIAKSTSSTRAVELVSRALASVPKRRTPLTLRLFVGLGDVRMSADRGSSSSGDLGRLRDGEDDRRGIRAFERAGATKVARHALKAKERTLRPH